jgi:hypothetical protein
MNKYLLSFLVTLLFNAFFYTGSLSALPLAVKGDSSRIELLLTTKMINTIHLDKKFISSLDITAKRLILLSTHEQFYLVGWGGIVPIGKKTTGNIGSFAFTNDNLLMVIRGNELCSFDSLGGLLKLYKLPGEGMGISAGKYVMYIYDRNENLQKFAFYAIAKKGKYLPLFEVPTPITSVIEVTNSILFSSGNGIFSYDLKDKKMKGIVYLAKDKKIISIAVDSASNRTYFSTENSVYALKDSSAFIISNEFGGVLRFFNNGLIVFNPEKNLLIRITGLEDKIASITGEMKSASKEAIQSAPAPIPVPVPISKPPSTEFAKPSPAETSASPKTEMHVPAGTLRVERFIASPLGPLEKGKLYILKKDFSQPVGILNTFPDGSVLKLAGADPSDIKSWKVVKTSDGSFALVDSKLYMYFDQAHVWLLKSTP